MENTDFKEPALIEPSKDDQLVLYGKLKEIAEAISFFEKRGRNEHHKYDYVQAVDVTRQVRDELLKRDLIIIPAASEATHLPFGELNKGKILTTVDMEYTVLDVGTGAKVRFPWVGVGADTGGDKGLYKAYTGGLKYALQSLFLVPMTADPEKDHLTDGQADDILRDTVHKDDLRPAAPLIPMDRATDIFRRAQALGYVEYDMNAAQGTAPKFHLALKAALGLRGVTKIGELTVDQAEGFEAWLTEEEARQAAE